MGDGNVCEEKPNKAPRELSGTCRNRLQVNGRPINAEVTTQGESVVFCLTAEARATYTITSTLDPDGLPDSVMKLWDTDRSTQLAENDDAESGEQGLGSEIIYTAETAGVRYVTVNAFDGSSMGGFSVSVSGPSTGGSTGSSGDEPCDGGMHLTRGSGVIEFSEDLPSATCQWQIRCPEQQQVSLSPGR
jgi:hypothetical protein